MTEVLPQIEHAERLQVELQTHETGKRVAIRLEAHDQGLGWYSSGSLVLPLSHLPLLEQAIAEMRAIQNHTHSDHGSKIIPFPGLEGTSDNVQTVVAAAN